MHYCSYTQTCKSSTMKSKITYLNNSSKVDKKDIYYILEPYHLITGVFGYTWSPLSKSATVFEKLKIVVKLGCRIVLAIVSVLFTDRFFAPGMELTSRIFVTGTKLLLNTGVIGSAVIGVYQFLVAKKAASLLDTLNNVDVVLKKLSLRRSSMRQRRFIKIYWLVTLGYTISVFISSLILSFLYSKNQFLSFSIPISMLLGASLTYNSIGSQYITILGMIWYRLFTCNQIFR